MIAPYLLALLSTAGAPADLDPFTLALPDYQRDGFRKVLQAVAQRHAGPLSLDASPGLTGQLILDHSAKWLRVKDPDREGGQSDESHPPSSGSTRDLDLLTSALPPYLRQDFVKALQTVTKNRATAISLADDSDATGELIRVLVAKWVQVDAVELEREIAHFGEVLHRKGKPKLLVMVAELNAPAGKPFAWWSTGKNEECGATDLQVFQDGFMNMLQGNGWSFVEQAAVRKVAKDQPPCQTLSDEDAVRLCKASGGGDVIVGHVTTSSPGPSSPMMSGLRASHAHVQLHLLDCASSETLLRINEEVGDISTLDLTEQGAGIKALNLAAKQEADAVASLLLNSGSKH